jgi:glyoxylase-like metal-dependent hydrolase (beta-lactamase superfamily II)
MSANRRIRLGRPIDAAVDAANNPAAMTALRFDIISIGTLSQNRLWNESEAVRTSHATTTLVRVGSRNILVDPGLPAPVIAARLKERTGLRPEQIDTVFLTNFRPAHRAGLEAFGRATVLLHAVEQQAAGQALRALLDERGEDVDPQSVQRELELLENTKPAEDAIARGVDLFPLAGYTPGTCGLLLSLPTLTILIAGDAVATQEHLVSAQVLPDCRDVAAAKQSLAEAYEIADLIVPGHDNVFVNPRSYGI